MGDKLVGILRALDKTDNALYETLDSAADRIEKLEAQRNFAQRQVVAAEIKLAKAVEAAVLQALHAAASEANYACGCKDAIYAIDPAHLAELKGEK